MDTHEEQLQLHLQYRTVLQSYHTELQRVVESWNIRYVTLLFRELSIKNNYFAFFNFINNFILAKVWQILQQTGQKLKFKVAIWRLLILFTGWEKCYLISCILEIHNISFLLEIFLIMELKRAIYFGST